MKRRSLSSSMPNNEGEYSHDFESEDENDDYPPMLSPPSLVRGFTEEEYYVAHATSKADRRTGSGPGSSRPCRMNRVDRKKKTKAKMASEKRKGRKQQRRRERDDKIRRSELDNTIWNDYLHWADDKICREKFLGRHFLHAACLYGVPSELVEAMVVGYPEAARATDDDGRLPLHCACYPWYGDVSPRVVRMLLDAYPEGAATNDGYGALPLHDAVKRNAPLETLRMLLDAYPDGAATNDGNGDLSLHIAVKRNAPLETLRMLLDAYPEGATTNNRNSYYPIHYLLEYRRASPNKVEDVLKVELLLRPLFDNEETCFVPHPWSGETPLDIGGKFNLLNVHKFLQIARCPAKVTMAVAQRHPEQLRETDENGSLPLHIVAASPNFNGRQVGDFIGEMVMMHPEAAASLDGDGRYPLNLAIESGKKWNEGVEAITDAAEHVATVKDEATGLFPFMLASTVDDPCITTVYSLLRRCPELKRYAID